MCHDSLKKILSCCLFLPASFLSSYAETWSNEEGTSIAASFLGIERGRVLLERGGIIYRVPPQNLSPEVRLRAAFYNHYLIEWAEQTRRRDRLEVDTIRELIRIAPEKMEGEHFYISGRITSISPPPYTLEESDEIRLRIDNEFVIRQSFGSFSGGGVVSKVGVHDRQVVVFSRRTRWVSTSRGRRSEVEWSPSSVLLRIGDEVLYRVRIQRGQIEQLSIVGGGSLSADVRIHRVLSSPAPIHRDIIRDRNRSMRVDYITAVINGTIQEMNLGTAIEPNLIRGENAYQPTEAELDSLQAELNRLLEASRP